MQKEIIYKGFSENPSDYECPDGELASSLGMVPEDNAMQPMLPPKEMGITLGEGDELFYIHKGNGYTHYIIKNGNSITYRNSNDTGGSVATLSGVTEAKSVGNTLILLNGDGMNYFLWQNNTYKNLGNHLPEMPISFGLSGRRVGSGQFSIRYDKSIDMTFAVPYDPQFPLLPVYDQDYYFRQNPDYLGSGNYSEELRNIVTAGVMAQVNRHLASWAHGSRFVFPFFVRYAYRLYDGSLTMHSAPILMACATHQNPYVFATPTIHLHEEEGSYEKIETDNDTYWKVTRRIRSQEMICFLIGTDFLLDYQLLGNNNVINIKNWKDIITSIDVFVSAPLYTIDQAGYCTGMGEGYSMPGHSISNPGGTINNYLSVEDAYYINVDASSPIRGQINLPLKSGHLEEVRSCSRFYLYHTIDVNDSLNTDRQAIYKEQGYLDSLTSRELMTDDYDSHDTLIPKSAFPYNSRLSIANIKKLIAKAFNPLASLPFTNGANQSVIIAVYLKIDNATKIVWCTDGYNYAMRSDAPIHYLYYPNRNAYQAKIFWSPAWEVWNSYTVPLKPHPTLNGAYYFSDWNLNRTITIGDYLPNETSREISLPNKLYTSEVNNPFYFPVSGIVTIGTANILDICSAARPLSEGQFGQFPLYAFTDEGVWALELSNDGTYKARQPITRDVCISTDSITQIDSAVLFATDRGIMLIQGSTATCISDELTTNNAFDSSKLPNLDKVLQDYAEEQDITYVPFLEYVKGCRMIYDYVHQRIIVFNPQYHYAYVYSLKSKKWGMMYSTIAGTVNSYPNALAVTDDGTTQTVVDYSGEEEAGEGQSLTGLKGVIITRPIKLDEPDTLKTVNTVITRGKFEKGHVQTILYGSRDLENWHLIASSVDHTLRYLHGTPYKYYRIVLLCDLDKGESIISSTVEYTPKYTDQIR